MWQCVDRLSVHVHDDLEVYNARDCVQIVNKKDVTIILHGCNIPFELNEINKPTSKFCRICTTEERALAKTVRPRS